MSHELERFIRESEKAAFSPAEERKRRKELFALLPEHTDPRGQFADLDLARKRAANRKHKVINNLDRYLQEFESNFLKHGGKVIWAPGEKDVHREILSILKKENIQGILKHKSILAEELDLAEFLKKNRREVWETDPGEFLLHLIGGKPAHVVNPLTDKPKEQIVKKLHEQFGLPEESTPDEILRFHRGHIRPHLTEADAGIIDAGFLVADSGAVVVQENEGGSLTGTAFPRVQIILAGIDRVIPSINDLSLFLPLYSAFATNQKISSYNHLVFGPKSNGEADGPEQVYVILVDNHRTEVLKFREQRQALYCINCGACMNVCPVYNTIGGTTYGTDIPGPVGSVTAPLVSGFRENNHLTHASTLCGKCSEICPVRIPLHELLLYNRHEFLRNGHHDSGWKSMMKWWKRAVLKRWYFDKPGPKLRNRIFRRFLAKKWGGHREFPRVAEKSFRELWTEKEKSG
jgi:L-lactate dehydrogenase complex protein LldF